MTKTRLFVTGFILLLFGSLIFGNTQPVVTFRGWLAGPSIFLLRTNTFFLNDFLHFTRESYLIEENRTLQRKITLLEKEVSMLQEKGRSSQRSEAFLAFQSNHMETEGLFCRIVGRDPSHWSETIFLDKGKRDGIEVDMAVIGTKGLVGRVVEVEGGWSKALLITDLDSKVGAILERNRESGLLVGTSRGLLTLEYLSPGADVHEGDKIVTAGFGEIFPKGIMIGEVIGFGRREEDLFMYALVKPAELLSRLEEVLCVKR